MEPPYDPAIPFLSIYPKGENQISKRYLHSHIECSIIHNCPDIEKNLSVHHWIMCKENMVYIIYTEKYYSATRKKDILLFATVWLELEDIMLSEISKTEKDKYCMVSLM